MASIHEEIDVQKNKISSIPLQRHYLHRKQSCEYHWLDFSMVLISQEFSQEECRLTH